MLHGCEPLLTTPYQESITPKIPPDRAGVVKGQRANVCMPYTQLSFPRTHYSDASFSIHEVIGTGKTSRSLRLDLILRRRRRSK